MIKLNQTSKAIITLGVIGIVLLISGITSMIQTVNDCPIVNTCDDVVNIFIIISIIGLLTAMVTPFLPVIIKEKKESKI